MVNGFLKSEDSLIDTHKVEDLFDFSLELNKLQSRIESIDKSTIIGLLGNYGSGKSTLLYQLEGKYADKDFLYIDLWKYPERTNLWKNFLYELSLHFGGGSRSESELGVG